MALDWLKPILGEGYSEDIDRLVSERIGEGFVPRADYDLDLALTRARAKNHTAARALLAERLGQWEETSELEEAVRKLASGADTAFLFEQEPIRFCGFVPGETGDPPESGFETRLAEARKAGDNLTAIRIKQEAAREGVVLA